MQENQRAMFPTFAGSVNGGGDDEDFGVFLSSSSPFSSLAPSLFPDPTTALRPAATTDDEDWGDFFSSPLGSSPLQRHSSSPFSPPLDPFSGVSPRHQSSLEFPQLNRKGWEKPKGAIPLSIFGEEDAEEPEQLEHPGVFDNGFAFNSLSRHSSPRRAPTVNLNDIIGSLYVQDGLGKEQEDSFDEGSWEFKDAFSADTRPKVDVNRLENGSEGMELFKTNYQQRITGGIFTTHAEHSDELLGNGALSIGANGFKLEFPENAIRNESTEKILADQAEVPHPPEKKEGKEVKWNMWDIDDLNISAFANGKNSPYECSDDHIVHSPGTVKMDDSPVALTSILENLSENADISHATLSSDSPINIVKEKDQHRNSAYINGDIDVNQFDLEVQNAAEIAKAENIISYESGQIRSSESTSYTLVDFYCRLREESLCLMVHHLHILKIPALPGATPDIKNINEEIQEAYGNLQERMASEDACTSKKIVSHVDQLINVTKTSNFKTVEHEYSLSKRLLAAEKDLNAAVELFVHSSSVLHILRLTSKEQQLIYINAWSKLASACAQELELGAKIWTESLDGNISKQLLIKGNKYFIALGEVFRLLKILKATVRFYMPWLLSNLEDSSEIVICLEKGNEAWINSGLEETLQTISIDADLDDMCLTKPLLEFIKLIDKVNGPTYQDPIFNCKHGVCKFYLLPLDKLPEIKTVVWNGDCYITQLANFWANRISLDPPELPFIMRS